MFGKGKNSGFSNGRSGPSEFMRNWRQSIRRWARDTFNREQFITSLKSLAWVAPLSILIWVYAERTQGREESHQSVPFQIRTNDVRQVVTVIRPAEQVVQADLEGPAAAVEEVVRNLLPNESNAGVVIVLPGDFVPGREYDIPASLLGDTSLFHDSGVILSRPAPTTLRIRIDKLVDVETSVQVAPGLDNFNSPPLFEPRLVKVTMPESLQKTIAAAGDAVSVYADLSRYDALRIPGKQVLPDVPLILGSAFHKDLDLTHVTISPERVTATLDVKNAESELKINSLPIWPLYPPTIQGKYVVKLDELFIPNVIVTGPREIIAQIDANTIEPRPKAILEISPEDVGKGPQTRKLEFAFPPA
jgi:hypothetical protein